MFEWLWGRGSALRTNVRKKTASAKARQPPAWAEASSRAAPRFIDAGPLPEVISEGNSQADWNAWEDSMTSLDSQLQQLTAAPRAPVRESRTAKLDPVDAFAGGKAKRQA